VRQQLRDKQEVLHIGQKWMTNDLLSGLEGLVALGRDGRLNMKPILFRVVTDQFVSKPKHPLADIRQYEELALQLLADADIASAACVAKRLGAHPDAPASVLEKLLDKAPEVAAAVLASGAAMDARKLIERAEWGSLAEAAAIAGRNNLDAKTAAALARRQETEVLCALAANKEAPLDAHAVSYLLQRGRTDRELGLVLLARTDLKLDKSPLFAISMHWPIWRPHKNGACSPSNSPCGSGAIQEAFSRSSATSRVSRLPSRSPRLECSRPTPRGSFCPASRISRIPSIASGC
jgi:hypothetical protein